MARGGGEEMAELLELPLRTATGSETGNAAAASDGIDSEGGNSRDTQVWQLGQLAVDALASVAFWYFMLFCDLPLPWLFFGLLLAAMVAFRLSCARTAPADSGVEVPYTCGYVAANEKELFLVATIHISPRAPRDVEQVIDSTIPDVAMIELDDERLDRMRDEEPASEPQLEDLQPVELEIGGERFTVLAQRALWNAERSGEQIGGEVHFEAANEHGLGSPSVSLRGKVALVRRGSPGGEFAPFALKAHRAARAGAEAVLVVNSEQKLPLQRVGGASLLGELKVALHSRSCGFPPIPLLLLPSEQGERLVQAAGSRAELRVLEDEYPRRTLLLRLCHACALVFSGIGVLYGVIQCFNVEVGAEFLAAEVAASARGIPCTCIDVDLNRFWGRLGSAVLPTPCNLARSLRAWLAFPRVCVQVLFPPRGNVDVLGSMVLHGYSFPLRTWLAFVLAGACASCVTHLILELLGSGVERAGEGTGVVQREDRSDAQYLIMLGVEMYLLPQIYDAVAASRDEAMYRSIVEKSRHARRSVVVVGAGHANGILQRARARGL